MEHVFESMVMNFSQHRDFAKGLPFYGEKGDFNFVMGRSNFTPGISIKSLPLTDLSVNGDVGITEFKGYVNTIQKVFKPGDRIRGIKINTMLKEDDDGELVVGKFDKMDIDYKNQRIRTYVKDPSTLKLSEIYTESMERIYESAHYSKSNRMVPDFESFISNQ
jgi:hypothetical protein